MPNIFPRGVQTPRVARDVAIFQFLGLFMQNRPSKGENGQKWPEMGRISGYTGSWAPGFIWANGGSPEVLNHSFNSHPFLADFQTWHQNYVSWIEPARNG